MVFAATGFVTSVKLALDAAAGTITEPGIVVTAEFPLLTVNVTVVSEFAAAPNVTVPVLLAPPMRDAGRKVNELGTLGVTVNVPVTLVPFALAEIFTVEDEAATLVEITKLAVELPARTVTAPGMEATAGPPLTTVSVTGTSTGAGPAMVTIPVVLKPPTTDVGLNLTELGKSGFMLRIVRLVVPP